MVCILRVALPESSSYSRRKPAPVAQEVEVHKIEYIEKVVEVPQIIYEDTFKKPWGLWLGFRGLGFRV